MSKSPEKSAVSSSLITDTNSLSELFYRLEQETDPESTQMLFEKISQRIQNTGPECLLVLMDLLRERFYREETLEAMARSLKQLAQHSAFMQEECKEASVAALKRFRQNSPELNAHLILVLVQFQAKEARTLIQEAFQAGAVYLPKTGPFESIVARFQAS